MPTLITHALVGVAGGAMAGRRRLPRSAWRACLLLPILPDIDVLAFRLGIPYEHLFGHRGIVHSLAFAAFTAAVALLILLRGMSPQWRRRWWLVWLGLFALSASHGVLDALTDGGLGIALFAPFHNTRYFFPVTPIAVSPIGLWGFLSWRGVEVLASEALWVWLPLTVIVGAVLVCKRLVGRCAARNSAVAAATGQESGTRPGDESPG